MISTASTTPATIIVPIIAKCSRCGGQHLDVPFFELRRPTPHGFTWWGTCPETDEPILSMKTAPIEVSLPRRADFFAEVAVERERQNKKWGTSTPGIWALFVVLGEEIGEVARAILKGEVANLHEEIVQSAAVLCRMFEHHSGGEGIVDSETPALVKPPHPDVGKCQDPSCDACHGLEPIR